MDIKIKRYRGWKNHGCEIIDGDGNIAVICVNLEHDEEDADFIVRAVNCHNDLICYAKELLARMVHEHARKHEIDELNSIIDEAEGKNNG